MFEDGEDAKEVKQEENRDPETSVPLTVIFEGKQG